MATPHIAGTMALLRQIYPTWSVTELKALVMNNANHDIFLNVGPALPKTGPGRVGAGREDLGVATSGSVVAYADDGTGRVSVSFGAVEVQTATSISRTIRVANKGLNTASFTIAYNGTNMPAVQGAGFSTSTGALTVIGGTSKTFTVTLSADPTAMRHSRD